MKAIQWASKYKSSRPQRDGWVLPGEVFPDSFSDFSGPFYTRPEGESAGVGFYADQHHGNYIGLVHGGALMTLIDILMWDICRRATKFHSLKVATVSLQTEFMSPCRVGNFVHGSGVVMKEGGKLIFARGQLESEGTTVVSFSGIMKKVSTS